MFVLRDKRDMDRREDRLTSGQERKSMISTSRLDSPSDLRACVFLVPVFCRRGLFCCRRLRDSDACMLCIHEAVNWPSVVFARLKRQPHSKQSHTSGKSNACDSPFEIAFSRHFVTHASLGQKEREERKLERQPSSQQGNRFPGPCVWCFSGRLLIFVDHEI